MMGNRSTFFSLSNSNKVDTAPSLLACVNLGNSANALFMAVAAAIIDLAFTAPNNRHLFSFILQQHGNYFKQQKFVHRLSTPAQRIQQLTNGVMMQAIMELAFTLRQITVQELFNSPLSYLPVFQGNITPQSFIKMQEWDNKLHENTLAALAGALKILITVCHIDNQKTIYKRHNYGENYRPLIALQSNQDQYWAMMIKPQRFMTLNSFSYSLNTELSFKENYNFKAIAAQINNAKLEIYKNYKQNIVRLKTMFATGELDIARAINLYIKGINTKFKGSCQIDLESFFQGINRQPVLGYSSYPKEEESIMTIIEGLAKMMSLGQFLETELDDLYEILDKKEARLTSF